MGVTVFASPWEPPANLTESGGSNGKLHLPKSNYAAYAKHLNDFGTYMKNNNVDLYAISVQNEPDYASEWTYWSTDETTDFIANYGRSDHKHPPDVTGIFSVCTGKRLMGAGRRQEILPEDLE